MVGFTDEVRAFLSEGTRTGKLAWAAKDGRPLVAPVWFVVDERTDELVFTTGALSAKGRALMRDPRLALCVDECSPPYSYVQVQGTATVSEDLDELRAWATRIGARYMGAERAEEFGRRNGVAGELLVRLCPVKVLSDFDVTG
ncbi:PPOX class F420-dependent oxidoreductase [Pseudonocardia thermophila]|uniref:PPOX class F420-dependent oxidoreductase n=1 Tax=Pseudonocardia thermophila TaxID=1848 RepID=UPI00248E476E|nr:PPOX class F420-dependent oxidoreductase [Pseudonocardia thermophila]